jgi:polyhydroxyalkanoate synthesis regulator phasin
MAEDARGAVPEEMNGLSTEEATERILQREDSLEPEAIRERLKYVTTDGVVCREGIEDGLTEAAEIISSPENRIDLALREFETATELATPVADLPVVAARLETLEERLTGLKEETDRLGPELNELFNEWLEEPDDLYAMADGLHQHATRGQQMHRIVDELITDLESFQEWVQEEGVRFDELERDVEGIDESLEDIETALAELPEEAKSDASGETEPDESDDPGQEARSDAEAGESVYVWVDAVMRHRLVGLLVDDLETELRGLRAWPGKEGDGARAAEIADRITEIRSRWTDLGDRIDAAARPAWRERFSDRLDAFENDFDAFEPPVDWGAVQRTLQDHQAEIGPGSDRGQ